jgi:hypothetical protein
MPDAREGRLALDTEGPGAHPVAMPLGGGLLAMGFLIGVYAVFGLLMHLLGLVGGAGLSIASGIARGVRAWATPAGEPPQRPASPVSPISPVPTEPLTR